MNSDKFVDKTPYEIYASKLDDGEYLCSIRTMYRILKPPAPLTIMKSHIAEGNYLLFIRYKSTNPQAINVTATISNKEIPLTKIARSIDDYGWFYILYFLRVNSTDNNNVLTLKIRSICNSVYIDFSS